MAGPAEALTYDAVFLSPHFDDAALSCGGTVALAARSGRVLVLTVFAGSPGNTVNSFARFQHNRWGIADSAVDHRKKEDTEAMAGLGAEHRWWSYPDAIYRGDLYLSDDDLFGPIKPGDQQVFESVAAAVKTLCQELRPRQLYVPLSAGGHVDHRLCLAATRELGNAETDVWAYEDVPYVLSDPEFWQPQVPRAVSEAVGATTWARRAEPHIVDVTDVLDRRLVAIAAYASQLPTIFRDLPDWRRAVRDYAARLGSAPGRSGERFWALKAQTT